MATYYFVGDGSEVIACEAYEANARDIANELNRKSGDDSHCVYSLTSDELNEKTRDDSRESGECYVHAAERAVCLDSYELSAN